MTCRLPGDFKLSNKWHTNDRNGSDRRQREIKQVLSQVRFSMMEHKTRYGFVITDQELVPIHRVENDDEDEEGYLEIADPIPWNYG